MTKRELTAMLPRNRHDVEAARKLVAIGLPAVEPVLKSLFQWLETGGSEVEMVIRPFFASAGAPALPLVKDALKAPIKPERKYALLRFVLPGWPRELVAQLENELMSLVRTTDFHGLDVHALSLMVAKRLGDSDELRRWREFKIDRLEQQLKALRAI